MDFQIWYMEVVWCSNLGSTGITQRSPHVKNASIFATPKKEKGANMGNTTIGWEKVATPDTGQIHLFTPEKNAMHGD
jgi:hypothetical protein